MNPTVYLYKEKDNEFELYLGEFTTLAGLNAIDSKINVELVSVGASNYHDYGWATEKEFPDWNSVAEVISFFKNEGEIGLVDFEIRIGKIGSLSTHDDGECHFWFKDKNDLINVLKTVVPINYRELLISGLFESPGKYIEIDGSGNLKKYHSFDEYLKETKNT